MGHTYAQLFYHGVFSTKNRLSLLDDKLIGELVRVIGGILRDRDGKLMALNGTENHVHLFASFHPSHAVSNMFRDIKAISCDWIHNTFPGMRDFAWQSGYGAFSVSKSVAPSVEAYIAGQKEHHKSQTFEDELVLLLKKHGLDFDLRYVFD